MPTILRREEKYALTASEAFCYAGRFSQFLQSDPFSHCGSYTVRSLYFDTPDDKDFYDKLNEQNLRRKVRIRIYHPDDTSAKLELKQKENIYQQKRSLTISRSDALALIEGNRSVLLNYHDPFAAEMYAIMVGECYRPRTIIEYQRKAFMAKENHIRITFDSCIDASESDHNLFSPTLAMHPILSRSNAILEIKYTHFLPGYLSSVLSQIDRRSVSASKYCMGRQMTHPHSF